jgi:hypothetical protein
MYEEIKDPMKVEDPLIKRVLYRLHFDTQLQKTEMGISGYDMGGRMYIVKWLGNMEYCIVKRRSCNVLCGARGCGMVFPFPTAYYLVKILDEKIPAEWNAWNGYASFTHEMHPGRQWKPAIEKLEKIYEDSKKN